LVPIKAKQYGQLAVPVRVPRGDDLHFALKYRQEKLQNKSNSFLLGFPAVEIRENMDMETYCTVMEACLQAERKERLLLYERYTQYHVPIDKQFIKRVGRAELRIKGISGARPAVEIGDSVVLRLTKPKRKWNMDLHLQCLDIQRASQYSDEGDLLQTNWVNKSISVTADFHVRIVPKADNHMRCLTALSWLAVVPEDLFQKLFFPTEAPALRPLNNDVSLPCSVGLNTEQLFFLRSMIQRTLQPEYQVFRPPVVLTGPAGTGKTKTLLTTIREVLNISNQNIRVLVCTSSHTAADVVTRRLSKFYTTKEVFRLYNADRPVATVPTEVLPFACQSAQSGRFSLPTVDDLFAFKIIVCTCYDSHVLYLAGLTNHQLRLRRMDIMHRVSLELRMCGVTTSTFVAEVNEPHFTHLFIDEAAQATEPETLIPLSVVLDPIEGSRKAEIALIGDPRQLSPEVYSTHAAKAGLGTSWMERLLRRPVQCLGGGDSALLGPDLSSIDAMLRYSFAQDGNEQISFFLTNSYRGHPSFLAMPSALFYADKLRWASYDRENRNEVLQNEWCRHLRHLETLSSAVIPASFEGRKQYGFPIHFRGIVGEDRSRTVACATVSEESWENDAEAKVVVDIVRSLIRDSGVHTSSIGVMAPFRGQVILIRNKLRAVGFSAVNVGTIEDFQGIEMDTIILSLTRSTAAFVKHDVNRRIGAFGQKKQANVALTRAEQLQVVIGNPNGIFVVRNFFCFFLALPCLTYLSFLNTVMVTDPYWRQYLWFCLRNVLWYGDEGETRAIFERIPTFPVVNTLVEAEDTEECVVKSRLESILCNQQS
jgi:hypothetical protein